MERLVRFVLDLTELMPVHASMSVIRWLRIENLFNHSPDASAHDASLLFGGNQAQLIKYFSQHFHGLFGQIIIVDNEGNSRPRDRMFNNRRPVGHVTEQESLLQGQGHQIEKCLPCHPSQRTRLSLRQPSGVS